MDGVFGIVGLFFEIIVDIRRGDVILVEVRSIRISVIGR